MTPRFFIGVAAASHVAAGVAGGFAMFAHGSRSAIERVRPGDWVAYYAPRQTMEAGNPVRAFTAIGKVAEGAPSESVMAPGHTGWQRPVVWLDARPAPVQGLLEQLSFVADRQHWGMYFRRSLFTVSEADFALIAQAMGVRAVLQNDMKP